MALAADRPLLPKLDRSQLGSLVQMAVKIRRLARNSKLGDDDAISSVGQFLPRRPRRTVRRAPDDGRQQPKETKPK